MKKWRMVGEPCTCCKDVVELLSYEKDNQIVFSLCKILLLEDVFRNDANHWVYALIIPDDKYPILISDACAKSILENPNTGFDLIFNRHFDRYR